jgi:benzoyl-CoA-dihydrodiol lyase
MLAKHKDDGLVREVTLLMKRVLKRLDMTAKSLFALVEPGSCFAGSLLELALAADRVYMLDSDAPDEGSRRALAAQRRAVPDGQRPHAPAVALPSRARAVSRVLETSGPHRHEGAREAGLVTFAPDDIDWDDEIRIAFEERASSRPTR